MGHRLNSTAAFNRIRGFIVTTILPKVQDLFSQLIYFINISSVNFRAKHIQNYFFPNQQSTHLLVFHLHKMLATSEHNNGFGSLIKKSVFGLLSLVLVIQYRVILSFHRCTNGCFIQKPQLLKLSLNGMKNEPQTS
jgi:hypothetical protein